MEFIEFREFVLAFILEGADSSTLSAEPVGDSDDLIESGLVDSHVFIDLCLAIEERLDVLIDIPNLEPKDFSSIRGLYSIATRPHA